MNDPGQRDEIQQIVAGPPQGYFIVMPMRPDDSAFNLRSAIAALFAGWKWLIAFGFLGAVLAVVVALTATPIYRAKVKAVLVDPADAGGASAMRNQIGGLAALAGFDLGNAAGRKQEAYATLTSAGFARDFIVAENLKPVLYPKLWDPAAKAWRAGEKEPSLEQAVQKFMTNVMFVTHDLRTEMVDVSIDWTSPQVAARWANLTVSRANERIRAEARRTADRSVEYLNQELAKTSVVELRQAIHRLIEVQINNAMLANVQTEYAFRVIDQAVAPEKRIRPQRTLMVLAGGVLGGIAGVLFVLIRSAWSRASDARHEKHA